jgi:hypothetical protein
MAYINGNKPIVTNGLVYALDFGNQKSYNSGSNRAVSLAYDPTVTIVTGSTAIPALVSGILNFTGSQFVQRSGSLEALDPTGSFTISLTVRAATTGSLFSQNLTGKNLGSRITTASSDFGFNLTQGTYSRTIPRTATTATLQHITYRYNSGTIDTFVNGLPVTSSVANPTILTSVATSSLFINSGSNSFSGSLANFYVYNRALTADEIWSNYQLSATRYGFATASNKPYSIDENLYQWIQSTGTTDTNTISSISTFISGLKSAGLWNKLQVIYPFVGTTTGSQTINLKEPGIYRLGLTGSFSASSAGLYPSSSTSFVDSIPGTTVHPLVNSASAHLSLLSYDLPTGNGFLGGNSLPALGGDVIISSGSKILHAFKTTGTSSFTMLNPSVTNVEVMVVAGGGGSPGSYAGGGGGAGGLVYSSSFTITPNTALQVIVGDGGLGYTNGQNSVFSTITAIGGGAGGNYLNYGSTTGLNGGSGGGGGGLTTLTSTQSGSGTPGQGFDGGAGSGNRQAGGGGGGAGGTGSNSANFSPGRGGSGSFYSQFSLVGGSPAGWFAGGGGGGADPGGDGAGGIGGGGTGVSGVTNTGGGAGGTRADVADRKGGSGTVIVSYNLPASALTGSGTGFYLTETSVTGSVNSQFTAGITGSGNIGLLTATRTQPGIFSLHKNSVSQSFASASLGALPTDIFFNTANLAGSGSLPLPATLAYASIGAGLTTSEVATYYNLVSQLQTNLKRQNTLLDNYSGAAAAYSLRRIGPSGYFGPAIRVRRDSDNTLRDIGFTSDGQLDTVGLLDFVGVTGSGFVQTWYDQSGNGYDASQGTTTRQPLVLSSGSVIINNSRVALNFSSSRYLQTPNNNNIKGNIKTFFVTANTSPSSGDGALFGKGNDDGAEDYFGLVRTGYLYFDIGDGAGPYADRGVSLTNNTTYLSTFYDSGLFPATLSIYLNGTDQNLNQSNNTRARSNTTNPLTIGAGRNGDLLSNTKAQEYLFYFNDQTANRSAIESNINTNYKIYGSATASFDPDYSAFITATGITQPTQSAALETLVSDLKSYGLWSKMKAIYPMVTDKNNRFGYSQTLATTWNATNVYVTQSFTTAPDGTFTGNFISESAVTDTHFIYQTISDGLVTGSEYVASIYGKFLNRPWIAMETNTGAKAWFNIQTGITGSLTGSNATITAVSGGWYRCALYFTSSVASGPQNIQYNLADANGNLSYAGVAGTGSYLWGAQFENGNVLGPYRATTTVGFTTGSMLDQMKYNLKNTGSFSGSYVGGWLPGYSGNKPNGVNGYMDSGLNPSASLSLNSNHLSYYSRTNTTNTIFVEMGCRIASSEVYISYEYQNISYFSNYGSAINSPPNITNPTGLFINNRMSSTVAKRFHKNVMATYSQISTSLISRNIFVGGYNNQSGLEYTQRECAFSSIGDGLTDYEAKALYWIVQKYQTTLGRQVY